MNVAAPLFRQGERGYYTDIGGYTHALYEQYTACNRIILSDILNIIDSLGLKYFLFAGSMVGYVRNKQMPAWMDDLDIIVFEEHKEFFISEIAPVLRACGFDCRAVDQPFEAGGFHILGMRLGNRRNNSIPFSDGISVSPPWAQVDVFFTRVDRKGFIRNLSGWGLYHGKNVPYTWVDPGCFVDIDGTRRRVFSEYEKDIELEYGDVHRNVVVQTHDKVFLRRNEMSFEYFENQRLSYLEETLEPGLPGISTSDLAKHKYSEKIYRSQKGDSLAGMVRGVISGSASTIILSDETQVFWAMDLRRLLPELKVIVDIATLPFASHAAHLRRFIDEVVSADEMLLDRHRDILAKLTELADGRVGGNLR
jgi:hypothetical protein